MARSRARRSAGFALDPPLDLSDIGRDGCVAYGAGYRSAPRAIRPDMETRLPRRASAPFPANAPRESASTGRHPVAAAHRRPRLARRAVAALVLPGAQIGRAHV